ncbi:MAG: putative NADPH-quinone reductase [Clostridiales bacterium]|jgi:putative NADPH-quinone reductase|nr:putative NADPH-quinone reductase [Clostridiales bacterium]
MKTLVIVAHPNMNGSRINKRFMEEIEKQPDVTINNLYETYPDEKIDILREQQLLLDHDRIVLQFPFYWYSTPSLLKKWQDEVLAFGWAYGPEGDKLSGKEIIVATSTGGPEHSYVAGGYNRYSMSELLKPLQAMSNLIGAKYLIPYVFHKAMMVTDEEVEAGAIDYIAHVLSTKLSNY